MRIKAKRIGTAKPGKQIGTARPGKHIGTATPGKQIGTARSDKRIGALAGKGWVKSLRDGSRVGQRKDWIKAKLRSHGVTYKEFRVGLRKLGVAIDLSGLEALARQDPTKFSKLVRLATAPERFSFTVGRQKGKLSAAPHAPEVDLTSWTRVDNMVEDMRTRLLDRQGKVSEADAAAALKAFADRLPDDTDPTEILGPYFDTSGLTMRLGVTRQALGGRVQRNTLLAVEADDGSILYPTWQFMPDLTMIDGLTPVLKELGRVAPDGFSKAVWLSAPQDRLFGHSAQQWLVAGRDPGRVVAAARADAERMRA